MFMLYSMIAPRPGCPCAGPRRVAQAPHGGGPWGRAKAMPDFAIERGCAGVVAGVDEAGRGPLAGPVVAAAVILDDQQPIKGLNDSKKLTPATRERLFDEIRAKALCLCIAEATVEEIDQINILQATMLAMRRAVE